MMTTTQIEAPHEVRDHAKLESLIAAYRSVGPVPPVVVLEYDSADYAFATAALCGSHRIAALREVYGEDDDISEHVIVIDGLALIAAIDATPESDWTWRHSAALTAAKRTESWADFDMIVEVLLPWLPEDAQTALADQH